MKEFSLRRRKADWRSWRGTRRNGNRTGRVKQPRPKGSRRGR